MDKPSPINGFTMLEALLVLLILSISTIAIPSITYQDSMVVFMKNIQSLSIYTQEKAFLLKKESHISFKEHEIQFVDYTYKIPSSISCDVTDLYFNEKGNINKGQTISCSNHKDTYKLIFQLGSGRVRYEKV